MIRSLRITLASTTGLVAFGLSASAGLAMPVTVQGGMPTYVGSPSSDGAAPVESMPAPPRRPAVQGAPAGTGGIIVVQSPAPRAAAATVTRDTVVTMPLPAPETSGPETSGPETAATETEAPGAETAVAEDLSSAPGTTALTEIVEDALAAPEQETQAGTASAPADEAAQAAQAEPEDVSPEASDAAAGDTRSETDVAEEAPPAPDAEELAETIEDVVEEAPPPPAMSTEVAEPDLPAEPELSNPSSETAEAAPVAEPDAPVAEPREPASTGMADNTDSPPAAEAPVATVEEAIEEPAAETAVETAEVSPSPADEDIAAALEEAISDGAAIGKSNSAALTKFYAGRQFSPLWVSGGRLDGQARAVVHRLRSAEAYGLDPARYPTPELDIGLDGQSTAVDLAAAEIGLTVAAVRFAQDAQTGTFDPAALGDLMTARPVRPETADVLKGLAGASDRVAYLEGFNPPQPQFKALQDLLARLRERTPEDVPPQIGDGPSLKPGMTDERIPLLRARLELPPVEGIDAHLYDDATVEAVEAFQEKASLEVDGVIGPQTRAALNGGAEITIADVLVNMERWRWVPREMGDLHVWVNIPEYWLRVMSGGAPMFETRVIVGKPENQTPVFSDEIEYVDVNPFWNVPRSIAVKEMLPHIRQDPGFLERQGLQVLYTTGGQEYLVNPYSVDWSRFNEDNLPFRFRQPPGNANALGRVKFMFPNKHAVYLHDTPSRNLFAKSVRAFSHGCVRVDNPVGFADALLSREDHLNGQRIKNLIGGGANGELPMKRHVPVHLTYFTVWVDSAGQTQKRPDIYDYDTRMKSAMGLGS
ncbi:L,D-transpeptidase family protein [Microbaculum marinum]|uniref:L,D-transpeptidase family protein n=1 Tax=Microbaculum marinum TaxID=1764581 RepID=A0AAW9RZV5_9HYPH